MIELLVPLVLFPLVGTATVALVGIPVPGTLVARSAFTYLAGVGANGALLYVLGLFGVPLRTATFIAIPALAVILVAIRWRSITTLSIVSRESHVVAGLVLALPMVIWVCAAAVLPTRGFDSHVTWLPKARAIVMESSIDGPFFQGQRGLNLHNRYPLLMPLNAAVVMTLRRDTRNETARWLYVLTAIAALVVLRSLLTGWFGAAGAWTAAAAAWLPALTSFEGGVLTAYNDIAVAAFFGVAVLYLLASQAYPSALRAVGLFAAFAMLTKNEGIALAIAVIFSAMAGSRPKSITHWTWVVAPVIAAHALLTCWRLNVPAAYDEQYGVLASTLPSSMHRVPAAMGALFTRAIGFSEWGAFGISVMVAAVIVVWSGRWRSTTVPLVAIGVALMTYITALTVTSWPIEALAAVAANRLLLHLLIPAAYVIAIALLGKERGRPDEGRGWS